MAPEIRHNNGQSSGMLSLFLVNKRESRNIFHSFATWLLLFYFFVMFAFFFRQKWRLTQNKRHMMLNTANKVKRVWKSKSSKLYGGFTLLLITVKEGIIHQTYLDQCLKRRGTLPMEWPPRCLIHPLFFWRESISEDSTGFERGQCDIRNVSGMIKPSPPSVRASHFQQIKSRAQLGEKQKFD